MGRALSVTMITTNRAPKENYLPITRVNLGTRKWISLFPSKKSDVGWEELGNWANVNLPDSDYLPCENAGRALVGGGEIALGEGIGWVLFLEDDLDFCDEFFSSVSLWLGDHATDRYRLYAFGCAYPQVLSLASGGRMIRNGKETSNATSWQYPYTSFYGTQAFAIRAGDAISLGAYLLTNPLVRGVHSPGAYDLMIHDWMRENYPDPRYSYFLASVPSFVQHIGRQSICTGLEQTHTFPSWPGREWKYEARRKRYGRLTGRQAADLGYLSAKVFVDGNEVAGCVEFDDGEGWADIYDLEEGQTVPVLNEEGTGIKIKRVFGQVRYIPNEKGERARKEEYGESKRAFLVLGPESSGTRVFTSILIAGGCHGSIEHQQPIDDPDYDIGEYDCVVWRRSVPHNGEDLNLQLLIDRLNRQGEREIIVVVVGRDIECNAKSQVFRGHSLTESSAIDRIRKANSSISEQIAEITRIIERITEIGAAVPIVSHVSYEDLLDNPIEYQRGLWDRLGLEAGIPVEIRNENEKWERGGRGGGK